MNREQAKPRISDNMLIAAIEHECLLLNVKPGAEFITGASIIIKERWYAPATKMSRENPTRTIRKLVRGTVIDLVRKALESRPSEPAGVSHDK